MFEGGANLSLGRKAGGGHLSGSLMELVQLLASEECCLRELTLADARLGKYISILLNALGPFRTLQAPTQPTLSPTDTVAKVGWE